MTIEEVRANVGNAVMSQHWSQMPSWTESWTPRGPYVIKQVTKGGLVILEGLPHERVRPTLLRLYLPPSARALG